MVERILKLISKSGITDSQICRSLGLANGIIGRWRAGKSGPSVESIAKLAKFFNVSTDYIIFGEEDNVLSPEDQQWLLIIHCLPENKRNEYKSRLEGYLEACEDHSRSEDVNKKNDKKAGD